MITKLLDSQSFSKVWKTAVRQKFCAIASKIWSADRLGVTSCCLSDEFLWKHWEKITSVIWSCDLKRVTMWNRYLYEMLHSTLLSAASKLQVQTILRFSIVGSIKASVLEVITSQNLQHVLHSYKHKAFRKVKCKLDLIEQPYLDKIHSRLRQQ